MAPARRRRRPPLICATNAAVLHLNEIRKRNHLAPVAPAGGQHDAVITDVAHAANDFPATWQSRALGVAWGPQSESGPTGTGG